MRKEDKIPGVYYSHDSKQSIPLYINTSDLIGAQKSNARIFTINVGGKVWGDWGIEMKDRSEIKLLKYDPGSGTPLLD